MWQLRRKYMRRSVAFINDALLRFSHSLSCRQCPEGVVGYVAVLHESVGISIASDYST